MGRFAKGLEYLGKSAVSAGPLDAVFAGFDYADGKAQGEDNIRAGLGAGGAAAGGIGGAMAGAALGQAAIPIPGVGAAIGAIGFGMLGGFGGGWGADRVDEAVRGNQGAAEAERNNDRNLATTAATGAGALAAGHKLSEGGKKLVNPLEQARAYGSNFSLAHPTVAGAFKSGVRRTGNAMQGASQAARNLPGPAKLLGAAALAGGATLAGNQMAGNPIGRAVDTITGQNTDFDGSQDPNGYRSDANAMPWQDQSRAFLDPRQAMNEVAGREDSRYIQQRDDAINFANMAHQKRMEYERDKDQRGHFYGMAKDRQTLDANREISFAGLQSDQAKARLDAFANAGQNASQQLATILNTRFY